MKPQGLRVTTVMCLVLAIGLITGLLLAPFDLHIYAVNGRSYGGHEFARLFGAPTALLAAALTTAGWGLWHERPWARAGLLGAIAAAAVAFTWMASIDGTGSVMSLGWRWLVLIALAGLYLYRGRTVRAYFDSLARAAGRSGA